MFNVFHSEQHLHKIYRNDFLLQHYILISQYYNDQLFRGYFALAAMSRFSRNFIYQKSHRKYHAGRIFSHQNLFTKTDKIINIGQINVSKAEVGRSYFSSL